MTDPNKTLIVGVLDRSGSMNTIAQATVDGWNELLAEQQAADIGSVEVALTQFDTIYETVYGPTPIEQAKRLFFAGQQWDSTGTFIEPVAPANTVQFIPRGMTALHDAIGRTITEIGSSLAKQPEDQRPGTVVIVVLTDGGENSSIEFRGKIKPLIDHQTEKYSWIFKFLGANQDAVAVGATLGVAAGQSMTYQPTASSTTAAFHSTSSSILRGRKARAAGVHGQALASSYAYTEEERTQVSES